MNAMSRLRILAMTALISVVPRVAAHADDVARGQYLARAADCEVCHTSQGGKPFAGGRAFQLPGMGTIYSANITPDAENGIGKWTDAQFVRAVRTGVAPGGKYLYPAMPYQDYARMSDGDIRAIRTWLATLKPVQAAPPDNVLRFPFSIRALMVFWNAVNGPSSSYPDDTSKSAAWNRGRYLVEGAGHCAECHSPRNWTMGVSSSKSYAGAVTAGWQAYNISSDSMSGIGRWTDKELTDYLSTGHADGHGTATGPMAEVVSHSLRYLTPEDIAAMVTYLRTLPARSEPMPATTPRSAMMLASAKRGEALFDGACIGCHLPNGTGRETSFAALGGARTTAGVAHARNLTQVLVEGSSLSTDKGEMHMPGFGSGLGDRDLSDIANYLIAENGTEKETAWQDVRNARAAQ